MAILLLEREPFLDTLGGLLRDAAPGEGRLALVSGEAGVGKTALVEHFTRAPGPAVRALWGRCDALPIPRPLGPLLDLAAQTGGELRDLLHADADRHLVFSACLRELRRHPSVVVVEDLQWADEATLDLLEFLGRRIHRTRSLLVATYCPDGLGPQHPLRSVLGALAASTAVGHLALAPLSVDAVRVLAGGRVVDPEALHQRTGGNPFYVTEVLASGENGVPPTVADAVLARAARLPPSARAVLDAAAVIGTRVERWLLAAVTAETQATEQCLDAEMLLARGDLLAFRHELARQTVLGSIGPARRAALHRRVLDALRTAAVADEEPNRLAHHAEAAGDREAVLRYVPAAARKASAASAHREAASLLALALRHAAGLPPGDHSLLLEAYAWECSLTARLAEAAAARRQAAELWRAAGNPRRQGENLAHLAGLLTGMGERAEAGRDLDDARPRLLAWQALTDVHLGRWSQAAQAVTEVLEAPAATVDSRIVALVASGRLRARRGDPGVSAVLDEALELAGRTSDLARLGPVRAARAEAAWLAGDRGRAGEEAGAAYDLAVRKRHPWLTGELAFWRWRAGEEVRLPPWTAGPYARQVGGDWRAAASAWQRLGCPYEQARALAGGGPDDWIAALALVERLGARPAAEALRRQLRDAGVGRIPRGPRPSTRENPFGLTTRQLEILRLLVERLTNTEIAARLHLSPKTVDHHVSAVLAKLDVRSRAAAAALARAHPLLRATRRTVSGSAPAGGARQPDRHACSVRP